MRLWGECCSCPADGQQGIRARRHADKGQDSLRGGQGAHGGHTLRHAHDCEAHAQLGLGARHLRKLRRALHAEGPDITFIMRPADGERLGGATPGDTEILRLHRRRAQARDLQGAHAARPAADSDPALAHGARQDGALPSKRRRYTARCAATRTSSVNCDAREHQQKHRGGARTDGADTPHGRAGHNGNASGTAFRARRGEKTKSEHIFERTWPNFTETN